MCSVSKVRVTIAHSKPVVRAGLDAALRAENFEVLSLSGAHGSGPEAAQLRSNSIVVTDFATGLRLAGAAPSRGCQVLIVTEQESETSIRRALETGVRGYLLLTSPLDAITRAVHAMMSGETALDPIVAAKMLASLHWDRLTAREIDVLRLMMQGLSNTTIATQLHRTLETVKSHVKAILRKLDATSRTEAVAIAQRRGLVQETDLQQSARVYQLSARKAAIHSTSTRAPSANPVAASALRAGSRARKYSR